MSLLNDFQREYQIVYARAEMHIIEVATTDASGNDKLDELEVDGPPAPGVVGELEGSGF